MSAQGNGEYSKMTMKGVNFITFLTHYDFVSVKINKHALLLFLPFRINCMEIFRQYKDLKKIKGAFLLKEVQL